MAGKNRYESFQKVLIIGAGFMGVQIAKQITEHGVKVVLYDINEKTMNQAKMQIIGDLIFFTSVLDQQIKDCDLVIETITEQLKLKQQVFREIEALVGMDIVFTTNSSLLLPSKISKKLKHKERFCGFHFYWPDQGANIVDIMPTRNTEDSVCKRLHDFSLAVGLEPVHVKKENYGYIYNDIFSDINSKAITLVIKRIGTIQDIDKSFRINTGCERGPFELMDRVGLDTVLHITRNIAKRKPKAYFGVLFLKRYVKAGKLGVKSGEGFYKY